MPEFEDDRLGLLFGLSKGSTPPPPLPHHSSSSNRSKPHREKKERNGETSPRTTTNTQSPDNLHGDNQDTSANSSHKHDDKDRKEDVDMAYTNAYTRIKRERKPKFTFKKQSSRSSRADKARRARELEEERKNNLYGPDRAKQDDGFEEWYESKSKRRRTSPEAVDEDGDTPMDDVHIPDRYKKDEKKDEKPRDTSRDRKKKDEKKDEKPRATSRDRKDRDRPHRSHRSSHRSSRKYRHRDEYTPEPDIPAPGPEDPDLAFRQSLFDAMADDEGAAFWESVYGQPLHTYPRPPPQRNERGELEEMNDDEYAAYVRQKMWEKSHEHILEERKRREEERERRKARDREEAKEWERRERERLHREKERRTRKSRQTMVERWSQYVLQWQEVLAAKDKEGVQPPWPVESGRLADVEKKRVEEFFLKGVKEGELEGALKMERVRWHPDKMQQRLGTLDKEVLEAVTAVFQTVDAMWGELRGKK
ncbi:hypothetical protein BJ508DRAFT_307071 [Ascobolus immersus RN42]|uniref:Uncharacterized protein n=1 Tax=Ascobolus immersus RN42 TaxID=1160509 RepID=A0A3N4I439_ASCIM|nr:hypothetical protein BJ508DRAFT_307071 [Ascobolus immersus RN42]